MPFKSKAQQAFMFAVHPKIAKRWAKETGKKKMKSLPKKVKKAATKKVAKKSVAKKRRK